MRIHAYGGDYRLILILKPDLFTMCTCTNKWFFNPSKGEEPTTIQEPFVKIYPDQQERKIRGLSLTEAVFPSKKPRVCFPFPGLVFYGSSFVRALQPKKITAEIVDPQTQKSISSLLTAVAISSLPHIGNLPIKTLKPLFIWLQAFDSFPGCVRL